MTLLEEYDLLFKMKIERWPFLRRYSDDYFGTQAIDAMIADGPHFDFSGKTVVQLAFENRYASLGGLAPATRNLTRQLEAMGERVIFLTPYHTRCPGMVKNRRNFKQVVAKTAFECGEYEGLFPVGATHRRAMDPTT